MSGVIKKFFLASVVMWVAPIAILYGFNNGLFPGSSQLSSSSQTLFSGFLAVISVNLVIAFYIIMAMKEPANREPQPDPTFLAQAKASVAQPVTNRDGQARDKVEKVNKKSMVSLPLTLTKCALSFCTYAFGLDALCLNPVLSEAEVLNPKWDNADYQRKKAGRLRA